MARPRIAIDVAEVERLASLGMTQAQIARALGISTDTLERRKQEREDVQQALARGRATGEAEVAEALKKQALEGNVRAQIFYLRCRAGWRERGTAGGGPFDAEEPRVSGQSARQQLIERLRRLANADADAPETPEYTRNTRKTSEHRTGPDASVTGLASARWALPVWNAVRGR